MAGPRGGPGSGHLQDDQGGVVVESAPEAPQQPVLDLPSARVGLPEGVALRQRIEDDTDRCTTLPWELLGEDRARWFAEVFEPPCERLLHRVDVTAGPNYQPASRLR